MVDILTRNAPLFSTTSDGPVVPPAAPPLRASSVEADNAPEMSPAEQAEATAAKRDGTPEPQPEVSADAPVEAKPEESDTPGETPPASKDDLPPHIKREITKARNQKREADERAKIAEAKVEKVMALLGEVEKRLPPPPAPPAADPKPTREQFTSPTEYDTALETWAVKEGERKAREALIVEAQKQREADEKKAVEAELARVNTEWEVSRAKASEKYEDFVEAVTSDDFVNTTPMAHAMMTSGDLGAEAAYYLAKHPDEAKQIAALPNPGLQLVAMGRLMAKLEAGPPKPEIPVSKAPAPITPVGANAAADTSDREPTMEEWAAKRTRELQSSRRPFIQAGNA